MGCVNSTETLEAKKSTIRRQKLPLIDCRRKSTRVSDSIVENVVLISENLTAQQSEFAARVLKNNQLFSSLETVEINAICAEMCCVEAECGYYIFRQGDPGGCFFIIELGVVDIEVDNKLVCTLKEEQAFGELALLFRSARAASVVTRGPVNRFLVMKPTLYKKTLKNMRLEQYVMNAKSVENVKLFECLTNKQKYSLSNNIKNITFAADDIIFREGDVSQALYIVAEGSVIIQIPGQNGIVLQRYELFGERSLKNQSTKRAGTVRALEKTVCAVIGRKDIEKMLGSTVQTLIFYSSKKWPLMQLQEMREFSPQELDRIIMAFVSILLSKGQKLDSRLFKGLVIPLEGGMNGKPEGTIFGAQGLGKSNFVAEDLVKDSPGYVGFLSYAKYQEIYDSIKNKRSLFQASQKCIPENLSQINLSDFQFIKKIGEGQFGKVFLVRNPNLGNSLYALKCLNINAIKDEAMEDAAIQERKILKTSLFPYIVGFVKAFKDPTYVYFLMEYLHGKEMFDVIREMPMLSKSIVRYYFGCLFLSIEYLHANNIIYRDLKPENSVVDCNGKVYLIDLGTAKELNRANLFRTFTIIGTPHYMAPEVMEGKGYSYEVDYWSLGVLLYELVCGKLPFGEEVKDHANIVAHIYKMAKHNKLTFPKYVVDEDFKEVVRLLLIKNPHQRSQEFSFDKVKKMAYFQGFDWDELLNEKSIPPYIPKDFKKKSNELVFKNCTTSFLGHLYGNNKEVDVSDWDDDFL